MKDSTFSAEFTFLARSLPMAYLLGLLEATDSLCACTRSSPKPLKEALLAGLLYDYCIPGNVVLEGLLSLYSYVYEFETESSTDSSKFIESSNPSSSSCCCIRRRRFCLRLSRKSFISWNVKSSSSDSLSS